MKSKLESEFPFGLLCPFCSCNLQKVEVNYRGAKEGKENLSERSKVVEGKENKNKDEREKKGKKKRERGEKKEKGQKGKKRDEGKKQNGKEEKEKGKKVALRLWYTLLMIFVTKFSYFVFKENK